MNQDTENILLSVVVPVYNAEKFLDKCIQSIIEYQGADLEVIIVDDGSKDHSLEVCRKWAERDRRIKVFSKQNGGVSSARNFGIDNAQGQYITFCDSDDYYSPHALETIRSALGNGCDLYLFCYNKFSAKKGYTPNLVLDQDIILTSEELAKDFWKYYSGGMINCGTNKVFCRSLILESGLRYDENMTFAEDATFNLQYLKKTRRLYMISKTLYNYISNDTQAIKRRHKDYFKMHEKMFGAIENFLCDYGEVGEVFYDYWLKMLIYSCYHQNFRLDNLSEMMNHPNTMQMCTRCRPSAIMEKIALFTIRYHMFPVFNGIYHVRCSLAEFATHFIRKGE